MADIDVSSSRCAGYVVMVLSGELDIRQATPLSRALSAAAATGSPVIVDLRELTLIDCSVLGALVYARQRALHAGGDLTLAAAGHSVLRLLSLTGLIDWLPAFASVDEAANGNGKPLRPKGLAGGRGSMPRARPHQSGVLAHMQPDRGASRAGPDLDQVADLLNDP
jgi:anti-sigma B factor antagonist